MTAKVVHPAELERILQARVVGAQARRTAAHRAPALAGRPRFRRGSAGLVVGLALALSATAVFADGGLLDVQVPDSTGYAFDTTTGDAIVEYIGKDNTDFGSSGTGVINSFLQTQDTPSEEGYNTNGVKQFDTGSSPTFNRAILVSEIPVVECEALDPDVSDPAETGLCWELFADINDSNANDPDAAQIQLTELEIWLTANQNITGYVQAGDAGFPSGANEVYDFEGNILINDVNSGSGRGDLRYLVPLSSIDLATLAPNCQYGSTACATYFVVYTEWGDTEGGDYISDSGFEEWTVKRYPFLEVEKTATTTFTRTFEWTIDKSVTPATWALFDGETGTSRYTVAVTKGAGTDSNWAVNGTITVTNPSDSDAVVASVTDSVSGAGAGAATVTCTGVTFPVTLDPGDTLNCTYSRSLPDGTSRTNTATATLDSGGAFTGTAAVTFGAPTTTVNGTIHVTDNNLALPGEPVAFSASGSVTVDKVFDCSSLTIADGASGSYTFNNTATITETSQADSASVDVTCYRLDVEKTADEASTRTWTWTIDKSADQDALTLMVGQSFVVNYSVTVNATSVDSAFGVSGTITITNPHPTRAATIDTVTDVISALGLTDVNATVSDCGGDTTAPYTVPAAGNVVCNYTASLDSGVDRTNTATATQQLYTFDHLVAATADGTENYSDTESVVFGGPASIIDECVTVTDTNVVSLVNPTGLLGTACAPADIPKTFTYPLTIGPFTVEQCGEINIDNTARFTTNDTATTGTDTWRVVVTIPCPQGCTLTQGYWKTHNETFPGGAPPDPNWSLIGDFDGDGTPEAENEAFFGTGQTWYQVFWTNVAGRPYYQLAHQWMAAYLNKLSIEDLGGTIPANVQTALTDGATFLDANDVNRDLKGKDAKSLRAQATALAATLADFNEGDIGPGHCDEDATSAPAFMMPPLLPVRRRRLGE